MHAVNHSVKITEKTVFTEKIYIPVGIFQLLALQLALHLQGQGKRRGSTQLRHDTDQGNRLKVVVVTMPPQAITGRRSERSVIQRPQD